MVDRVAVYALLSIVSAESSCAANTAVVEGCLMGAFADSTNRRLPTQYLTMSITKASFAERLVSKWLKIGDFQKHSPN